MCQCHSRVFPLFLLAWNFGLELSLNSWTFQACRSGSQSSRLHLSISSLLPTMKSMPESEPGTYLPERALAELDGCAKSLGETRFLFHPASA